MSYKVTLQGADLAIAKKSGESQIVGEQYKEGIADVTGKPSERKSRTGNPYLSLPTSMGVAQLRLEGGEGTQVSFSKVKFSSSELEKKLYFYHCQPLNAEWVGAQEEVAEATKEVQQPS